MKSPAAPRSATCYPQPYKRKAIDVCRAFADGAPGGRCVEHTPPNLLPGSAMFYGVRPAWQHLWGQAKAEGRDWYYADNGLIPSGGQFFRVAKNAVQAVVPGAIDWRRADALGIAIRPWRRAGRHVLLCLQSDEFMATVCGQPVFNERIGEYIAAVTDRPVAIRRKGDPAPIEAALRDAWCVVTWQSNAAVDAILAGVPAIVLGQSAAAPMAGTRLDEIEDPPARDGRAEWLATMAASQWTLGEMRAGDCWRALNAS
jgi:hypothetical protein